MMNSQTLSSEKLFLVTREDLPPGQQAVQACHAMTEFLFEYSEEASSWRAQSNTLAFLVVPNEESLHRLIDKANRKGIRFSMFREPDRENELTAVAFEPRAKSMVSQVPLALTNWGPK